MLQEKLDQPISSPPSPRDLHSSDMAGLLSQNINTLRQEVNNLRNQLVAAQTERKSTKYRECMLVFALNETCFKETFPRCIDALQQHKIVITAQNHYEFFHNQLKIYLRYLIFNR